MEDRKTCAAKSSIPVVCVLISCDVGRCVFFAVAISEGYYYAAFAKHKH